MNTRRVVHLYNLGRWNGQEPDGPIVQAREACHSLGHKPVTIRNDAWTHHHTICEDCGYEYDYQSND